MSICAERVAFVKALSEGERDFEYIVVCGGKDIHNLENCLPCGFCRQFMNEFTNKDFIVYALGKDDIITKYSVQELLPYSFKLK